MIKSLVTSWNDGVMAIDELQNGKADACRTWQHCSRMTCTTSELTTFHVEQGKFIACLQDCQQEFGARIAPVRLQQKRCSDRLTVS